MGSCFRARPRNRRNRGHKGATGVLSVRMLYHEYGKEAVLDKPVGLPVALPARDALAKVVRST